MLETRPSITERIENVKAHVSLQEYASSHLQKSRGPYYVCPLCGSGTHANATGALSVDTSTQRWTCFACHAGGDVLDLAGAVERTEDTREQLEAVERWAGIRCTGERAHATSHRPTDTTPNGLAAQETAASAAREATERGREAQAQYIADCRVNMLPSTPGYDYLRGRGFTGEEIAAYGLGWDPLRDRVVIPWSTRPGEYYHQDRDITGRASHKYDTPKREQVGPKPLMVTRPLEDAAQAVWVCEGAIDALSIDAIGHAAIACAGTAWQQAAERLSSAGYGGTVIACFDADPEDGAKGNAANTAFAEALQAAGLDVHIAQGLSAMGKDPNEALARDRSSFAAWLADEERAALEARHEREAERHVALMRKLRVQDPAETLDGIVSMATLTDPVPTGIARLDAVLNGGLPVGVTVLGAVSSLGKTTLTVQIADTIAAHGHPVLFVTIEQSAAELESKSLSRIMGELATNASEGCVPSWEILSRSKRKAWGEGRKQLFEQAVSAYREQVAPYLRIYEGTHRPTPADIATAIDVVASYYGTAPVVIVDYLQLLAAEDPRADDKKAIDEAMSALRRIARDAGAALLVISSLNRASYSGAVDMKAFKESGAIEYGSDVLLGLQPRGISERLEGMGEKQAAREAESVMRQTKRSFERKCELVVLKHRNGALPPSPLPVTFIPARSTFTCD